MSELWFLAGMIGAAMIGLLIVFLIWYFREWIWGIE